MTEPLVVDVPALYAAFFARGGPPPGDQSRPWRYRRKDTSLGLPTVRLLATLVRERPTATVLDLGSGLTSYLLHALMGELPGLTVVTTDTSPGWLDRTVGELVRDGYDAQNCHRHPAFEEGHRGREQYGIVSVDIFNTPYRLTLAPKLAGWLGLGGIMLLDDWHMPHYAVPMTDALLKLGLRVEPQPGTTDEFGRFCALAWWP